MLTVLMLAMATKMPLAAPLTYSRANAPSFACPDAPAPLPVPREAVVNGATLRYYDTGGPGPAVVLMHAHTGSAQSWSYQLPALAGAGFRVIAYSRRGHLGSSDAADDKPGRSAQDLAALVDDLHIARFHLVGTAAGGFLALDFALHNSQRLLSLTLASTNASVDEADFAATIASLTPPPFASLPPQVRELGPSFRAACQPATQAWLLDEHSAKAPGTKLPLKEGSTTWNGIEKLTVPVLLMTGDADLYMPPSQMAVLAKHVRNVRYVILPGAGHAAYWEQPARFNKALLNFLATARPATP